MARGRFISRTLGESEKFAEVDNDTQRVMYMLMVANADCEGRLKGKPLWLGGKVFTYLDYTHAQINEALETMSRVGLIRWYEVEGERYVEIVKFHEHNKIRRDDDGVPTHEAPSVIPGSDVPDAKPVTTESLRSSDVGAPLKGLRVKGEGSRVKREDADSAEARFARMAETGTSEHHETSRARATIRRVAGPTFASKNEDSMPTWSRWTDKQLRDLWTASDPKLWPGEERKRREWIYVDLLNEDRHPDATSKGDQADEIRRKYHHVEGEHDGMPFIVVGITPSGSHLLTDIGPLTVQQVEEGSCRQAN